MSGSAVAGKQRDTLAGVLFDLADAVHDAGNRDVTICAFNGWGEALLTLSEKQKRALLRFRIAARKSPGDVARALP